MRVQPIQGRRECGLNNSHGMATIIKGESFMLYRNICLALSCVFALSAVQSSFAQDALPWKAMLVTTLRQRS